MSDYTKATNFATKDSLLTGDPNKKVKGTEIDAEFVAIQTAIATKADKNSPAFTGSPTAPTASNSEDSTVLATTEFVKNIINAVEPLGTIKAWGASTSTIPTGWAICNGSNGTIDLRDRFIIAAGSVFPQGQTGGEGPGYYLSVAGNTTSGGSHNHGGQTAGHTLTVDEIPNHTHNFTGYSETNSVGTNPATTGNPTPSTTVTTGSAGGGNSHAHGISSDGSHSHTLTGASSSIPAFYALVFIQKIALL